MQCPTQRGDGEDLLIAFTAGRLAPEEEIAFRRHIALCSECRTLADAQTELWQALDAWVPLPVSRDFDAKVYARIAAAERQPWYRKLRLFQWSFRGAAMPFAAACAALLIAFLLRTPLTVEAPPPAQAITHKVDIERLEQALDDLDMLKQLGVVAPATSGVHQEPM